MNDKLKRILALVLGVALLASAIPAALLLRKGPKNTLTTDPGAMPEGTEFISMPITIRDFAADGMLFEFNQFEKPGEYYTAGTTQYAGLKAYFAEAPEVDVYDKKQFSDGANKKQNKGYVTYYPADNGLKLSFRMVGLNNGANYTRGDVDYVVIKFRTSKTYSTTNYPTINEGAKYSKPFVAQRGPDADKADPYGSNLKLYNNDRTLSMYGDDYKTVVTPWTELVGTASAGDWRYVKVHLSGGTAEVTYISMYINQKQGHVDFGGMWVFSSNDAAKAFIAAGYKYETNEYYLGDNKGYGMLLTDDNDYYNGLPSTSNNIAGSKLCINGSWGDTTEPAAIDATLNSGAKQKVHGAAIRTDLVEAKLKDGKPVYTDATVTYMQGMLKKTLPVAWERTPEHGGDNAYNMYCVMGVKLYNDAWEYVGPGHANATKDLAQLLRDRITEDGTLEATKEKVAAGNLTVPTDIETYYDAAYYLLHNTWTDSAQDTATTNDGYGMPIKNYTKLNLIETTNTKGQKCYVFNSGYDAATYDAVTGEIYNTQVSTMTKVQDTTVHATGIIRGMVLPENRFDPLSTLGYGISGNIYATVGLRNDQWKDTYYAKTNYNLSLEGHAKFVYYQDANQYFTFTGDDDVYLYIDGIRVLDLGGAHSISKVSINLNDVAKVLGLVDGQIYDFDFFYMERHGTAANFGIETNIQIVDPSMITGKTGYQNGVNTGYNGYVDDSKPVTYEFSLENDGTEAIRNLEFHDAQLGLVMTKDEVSKNGTALTAEDYQKLSVTKLDKDGTTKSYMAAGTVTETALKTYLESGLAVGEKIIIYGIDYTIAWKDNSNFYNTVNTYATTVSGAKLSGIAHWVVQKKLANYSDIHLYNWGYMNTDTADSTDLRSGGSVALTREELNAVIQAAGEESSSSDTIQISNATGITDKEQTNNINERATVSGDTITYTTGHTGVDIYYVMVGKNGPIRVAVYTYGVADNTFVLDYGLQAKFTQDVLKGNSVVNLAHQNPIGTSSTLVVSTKTSNYGTSSGGADLVYTMNKIMNGEDTVEVTWAIQEKGTSGQITKFNGVEMPQKVTIVPASVMYYEDDFPGLTYTGTWTQYGTGGNEQSVDQNMNYGSDPNYIGDKGAPQPLLGDASNGTIKVHEVGEGDYEIMQFTFTGTGFEVISRTTDLDYCIMRVSVTKSDGSKAYFSNDTEFIPFPAICESESGDLYQVPVISVTGLKHDTYTVTLDVSNNADENNTTPRVYMDGIRIYHPLISEKEKTYYSANEAQATITEVKKLIKAGTVVYASKASQDGYVLAAGDTAIENYLADGKKLVLKESVDLNEYLKYGPNNELYLDGANSGFSVIAFYLKENEDFTSEQRTIQIGVHRKTDAHFGDTTNNTDSVRLVYGSNGDVLTQGSHVATVKSGTEQYVTIDVANLEKDSEGRYLVIVGMSSDGIKGVNPVLSITNVKLSGYTIVDDFDLKLQDLPAAPGESGE